MYIRAAPRGHLIRSSMCGHPDPFRSVRHLGGVPVGCPLQSGEPGSRSSVWLPAWLLAGDNGASSRRRSSLGYENREAGFRCLAWSPEPGLTWVNVMRFVSDEASRLSVHTPFQGVSCTDSCTRQSSGTVLRTVTAQIGHSSVACGNACRLDRRLRFISRMSHAVGMLMARCSRPGSS